MMKRSLFRIAVTLVLSGILVECTRAEFTEWQRKAVDDVVAQTDGKLQSSSVLKGKRICLVVTGDQGKFAEKLLTDVMRRAKMIPSFPPPDANHADWAAVLVKADTYQNVEVSERFSKNQLIHYGKLARAEIVLHAEITFVNFRKRIRANLVMNAIDIEKGEYIWEDYIKIRGGKVNADLNQRLVEQIALSPGEIHVTVLSKEADRKSKSLADAVASSTKEAPAQEGYQVHGEGTPDILVSLVTHRGPSDKLGASCFFSGITRGLVKIIGTQNVTQSEKPIYAKGERAVGEDAAERKLADKLTNEIMNWLRQTIRPEKWGVVRESFTLAFVGEESQGKNLSTAEKFRKVLELMPGVRKVTGTAQKWDGDCLCVPFCAVYEPSLYKGGLLGSAFLKYPQLVELLAE